MFAIPRCYSIVLALTKTLSVSGKKAKGGMVVRPKFFVIMQGSCSADLKRCEVPGKLIEACTGNTSFFR